MKSRLMFAATAAFALAAFSPSTAQAQCVGTEIDADALAPADRAGLAGCDSGAFDGPVTDQFLNVQYLGSGAGFWHSLWAFTSADLAGYPAGFTPGATGELLFCKIAGCVTNANPVYADQITNVAWGAGTDLIFGLYVLPSGTGGVTGVGGNGYWIFSSNMLNADTEAHIAFFKDNVYRDTRTELLVSTGDPGYPGGLNIMGFEDLCDRTVSDRPDGCFQGADWDFNDAVIAWQFSDSPLEVVPEPATMTLLATGLVGMAAARRRRNNKK